MKIGFVGSSYFSLNEPADCEPSLTDMVYFIAKRNPEQEFVNLSIPGHGWDSTVSRVDFTLNNYDPDCFIIEIPGGLRWIMSSELFKEIPHDRRWRIQEYKNGERFTAIELSGEMLHLDNNLSTLEPAEIRSLALTKSFDLKLEAIPSLVKFLGMIDNQYHRCHIVNEARMLQTYLQRKNKKVVFLEWKMEDNMYLTDDCKGIVTCCETSNNAYKELNLLTKPYPLVLTWMLQDGYITKTRLEQERLHGIGEATKNFHREKCFDGWHLNNEALERYASTFDQQIKDWVNE